MEPVSGWELHNNIEWIHSFDEYHDWLIKKQY